MKEISEAIQVYTEENNLVANIVLNGYNIETGGPFGRHGAMRSFMILDGNLWDEWYDQVELVLHNGTRARINNPSGGSASGRRQLRID